MMSTSSAKRTLRWRPVGDTLLLVEEAEARYDGPLASNVAACALAACGLGSGGAMRSSGLRRCVCGEKVDQKCCKRCYSVGGSLP